VYSGSCRAGASGLTIHEPENEPARTRNEPELRTTYLNFLRFFFIKSKYYHFISYIFAWKIGLGLSEIEFRRTK
jgi:hypothetical protein